MSTKPKIVVASDAGIFIRSLSDISEALNTCIMAHALILTEQDLATEFFDLRTGLAGELFQKFTNFRKRLAIVLPNPAAYGERVVELAREHSSHSLIRFVNSKEEAETWLNS